MNEDDAEALNTIFSMAARNPEFRNKLFEEPAAILEKYKVSDKAKRTIIDAFNRMLNQ